MVPKQLLSQWHLPRVCSSMLQGNTSQPPICGTSSFAFQGTNAHIVQEQGPLIGNREGQQSALAWQKQRHWVAPPMSAFITGAMITVAAGVSGGYGGGVMVVMEVDLISARAAFLREHCVMQHAVFPAAGFVELCGSVAAIMTHHHDVSGRPHPSMIAPCRFEHDSVLMFWQCNNVLCACLSCFVCSIYIMGRMPASMSVLLYVTVVKAVCFLTPRIICRVGDHRCSAAGLAAIEPQSARCSKGTAVICVHACIRP